MTAPDPDDDEAVERVRMIGGRVIADATFHRLSRALLAARTRAHLMQRTVARRMGTTKSAISRLENAAGHRPTLRTLERYADAVGCRLEIRLVLKPFDRR
jgi:predicted transcriptional regulator